VESFEDEAKKKKGVKKSHAQGDGSAHERE